MSDILEYVLSNHNERTELYQNRLCVSQEHYLTFQQKKLPQKYMCHVYGVIITRNVQIDFLRKLQEIGIWKCDSSDIIHV